MATPLTKALQQSNVDWVNSQPYRFNVAICLHLPDTYRSAQNGWSDSALRTKLRRFFNRLDSKVLKAAHRHGKKRVPRFIVLEKGAAVGWHAHALLSSETSKMSTEQLCMAVKLLWHEELGNPGTNGFHARLAWAKPAGDRYARYMTKSLYGPNATGIFDDMNTAFN